MPLLVLKLVFLRLPLDAPLLLRPLVRTISQRVQDSFVDPRLAEHVNYWEQELSQRAWFAGDEFTAADIQMSFPV